MLKCLILDHIFSATDQEKLINFSTKTYSGLYQTSRMKVFFVKIDNDWQLFFKIFLILLPRQLEIF